MSGKPSRRSSNFESEIHHRRLDHACPHCFKPASLTAQKSMRNLDDGMVGRRSELDGQRSLRTLFATEDESCGDEEIHSEQCLLGELDEACR